MRQARILCVLGVTALLAPGAMQAQATPAAAPAPGTAAAQSPENKAVNERFVQQYMQRIAGSENAPAEQVFENIEILKGIPARQLLTIMNDGYAAALGVTCTHCHAEKDFGSDDKRPKRAAREMAVMHRMINAQLKDMKELATPPTANRAINCATCHRGMIDPVQR